MSTTPYSLRPCLECNGTGIKIRYPDQPDVRCWQCAGTGRIFEVNQE